MKNFIKIPDINDLLIILGLSGLFYGLYLWSLPLAFVITGSILAIIGLVGAWLKGMRR